MAVALLLAAAAVVGLTDHFRVRKRLFRQPLWADNRASSPAGKTWAAVLIGGAGEDRLAGRTRAAGEARPAAEAHALGPSERYGLRDTAMMLELVGAMLDAGAGIGRALELVAASSSPEFNRALRPVVSALSIGADWETAWRSSDAQPPELRGLRDALGFAALTGAPSSAILYAQAARMRRDSFRAAEKRAAALGVKLVIPLGLCSLPAFVCLGVLPVLLAMLPAGP
jgi:pilus assembly protein TadC